MGRMCVHCAAIMCGRMVGVVYGVVVVGGSLMFGEGVCRRRFGIVAVGRGGGMTIVGGM